jgi:septal ring factor EnvC (AmiA/AmiB activator)
MSYGAMTVIEHPGDWYTVYGRLEKWTVERGQAIKAGDAVGATGVGADGNSETYFELRFYGKPTDPMPWLAP